ncbi:MAG: PAS domain-containing sensor histidine kinase [Cytophagaceae bacterium]|nr:PAS domain-containing sensor histidine kinase [Cytophagaceae bacterium]
MYKREENTQLKELDYSYQALAESVKDYALIMLDPEGKVALWNPGAERIKGYTAREIIGKHFSVFYPKKAQEDKFPEYELKVAKEVGRFEDEGWRVKKDGSLFWANVVISAVYNSENLFIGFSKVTRDLSERKKAEETLRRSEERYRLLIEGVKDYAIFMLDPTGHIASWNLGAKRLKGYTENEIIGKHFSIFYPEEAKKINYPEMELRVAKEKGRFEDEGWRVKKDGSLFYANVIITALFNNNKEHIGFSKITRDLTERKRMEEGMRAMNAELEKRVQERTEDLTKTVSELKKINSDLDNFIYTASHDLKAPVSNIEGLMYTLVETLKDNNFTNDEVDSLLEMINKSVSRFQNTIKDLTAVNQSQRYAEEDLININLSEVIDDIAASINHLITESKAHISIEIQDAPDFSFSKIHIRSIMYNLLTNAIKYRSPERQLYIIIKAYSQDEKYIIEVSDNGLGIKEENKEKIFQMFKRMHDHVEGSGIGLYIVRRIVDNSGGRIQVESKEGKGTTFKIYLPKK